MDKGAQIRELLCPKEQWINDKDVSKCMCCEKTFVPLLVWRHHCRFCGRVFCNECASNVMSGETIDHVEKKLRHCNPCKMRIELVLNQQSNGYRRSSDQYSIAGRTLKI
jgi:hypothetical protein